MHSKKRLQLPRAFSRGVDLADGSPANWLLTRAAQFLVGFHLFKLWCKVHFLLDRPVGCHVGLSVSRWLIITDQLTTWQLMPDPRQEAAGGNFSKITSIFWTTIQKFNFSVNRKIPKILDGNIQQSFFTFSFTKRSISCHCVSDDTFRRLYWCDPGKWGYDEHDDHDHEDQCPWWPWPWKWIKMGENRSKGIKINEQWWLMRSLWLEYLPNTK